MDTTSASFTAEVSLASAAGDDTENQPGHLPRKMLVVVHRRDAQPGNVGLWLKAHGYTLDIRCPRHGDPLPPTLAAHAGAVVFGGPMSANDPDDYIRREIDWLAVPLRENKPFFGICLGAQMLAKHLGGDVRSHPEGYMEAGYCPIQPSQAGAALLPSWPARVYQWHREGFTVPGGAERLACGDVFENQAFRYGPRAFGVQFHPEMTLAMIHRWTAMAAHRLSPGGQPAPEHFAAHCTHGAPLKNWLAQFMTLWLGHAEA